MSTSQSPRALNDTVIANGYCVGCGACAIPEQSPFTIVMDDYGQYQSRLSGPKVFAKTESDYEQICPFGSRAPNEDEIAAQYYSETCEHNTQLGYYKGVYAGYVTEGEFRSRGSSGGMGSWVLNELLEQNLVDYVLHVKSASADEDLNKIPFKYSISKSADEVQQGGKSRYYPIELSEVLETVLGQPGRYAVVGIPCFIKSIRLLQRQDPILAERIHYCVGLVCGHLKSANYAESLAWQMEIEPSDLKAIDFRIKDLSQSANRYSTYAKGSIIEKTVPTSKLFGKDWGAGAFKYKACDFCDDVYAETADVVLGDAWLPQYVKDSYGTSIVITRSVEIERLISNASVEKRLKLDQLSIGDAQRSQGAGLRHRKNAIAYRLYCEVIKGHWVPSKRVAPSPNLDPRREMKRQRLRTKLRDVSHRSFLEAKRCNDIRIYFNAMNPIYEDYLRLSRSLVRRTLSPVKQALKRLLNR